MPPRSQDNTSACSSLAGEVSIVDGISDENLHLHCIENQKMTPATNNEVRTVRFGTVKIREYESTLGDNPSVRNGPPIGLGWKSKDLKDFTVDEFEEGRSSIRRGSDDILISRFDREQLLKNVGIARMEMAAAIREARRIQRQRLATVNNLSLAKYEENLESLRKFLFCSCIASNVAEPGTMYVRNNCKRGESNSYGNMQSVREQRMSHVV